MGKVKIGSLRGPKGDPGPGAEDLDGIFISSDDVRSIEKVTQAEYDALPTPRPTDVLYVITP
jgi:hypothetical protein